MAGIIWKRARAIALLAVLALFGLGIGLPVNTTYAGDCLAAPNSSAPEGSHWYYRIEHATKLKCWYLHALDEAGQKTVAGSETWNCFLSAIAVNRCAVCVAAGSIGWRSNFTDSDRQS